MGFHRHRDGGTFHRNWPPVFKGISVFTRGILRRKGGRCTFHIADSSNTELLSRTVHSANHRSVSTEQYQAGVKKVPQWIPNQKRVDRGEVRSQRKRTATQKNVKPQEVNSLVQTPRSGNEASGNRLREQLQGFDTLEKEIQFTGVCEDATFARRVSIGMRNKTTPDVDDGFGDRTPAYREYTRLREDQNSRIYATIPGHKFFKFISHDILTSAELKFRFLPKKGLIEPPG